MKIAINTDWTFNWTDKNWHLTVQGKTICIESRVKDEGHFYRAVASGVGHVDYDPEKRLDEVKADILYQLCTYHHFTILEETNG